MSTCVLRLHDSSRGGIGWKKGAKPVWFWYVFWLGLTVLAAAALGRLKRWLLRMAERRQKFTEM